MEKEFEKLKDLIKDIDVAMMATVDNENEIRSRPMATTQIKENGILWFFTYENSPKTEEIDHNRHVNISYSDKENQRFVSASGTAITVKDRNKIEELWNPIMNAWFDKGKEDPNICLIRVELDKAEYWDAPSGISKTFEMAKSALTDSRFDKGENKKLRF